MEDLLAALKRGGYTISPVFGVKLSNSMLQRVNVIASARALGQTDTLSSSGDNKGKLADSIVKYCRTIVASGGAQPAPIAAAADPGGRGCFLSLSLCVPDLAAFLSFAG